MSTKETKPAAGERKPKPAATLTGAEELFENWCEKVQQRESLADATKNVNKVMWRAYAEWLVDQGIAGWPAATAETINKFLNGAAPGKNSRRNTLKDNVMSNFTRQRYWRILRGVYHHASGQGWIEDNPCIGMDDAVPHILGRDLQPQVLPPGLLALLQDQHLLRAVHAPNPERPGDWTALRDRAAMALLTECGLTTAELIALRGKDLAVGETALILAMQNTRSAQRSLGGDRRDPLATLTPEDNPAGARHPGAPVRLDVPSSSDTVSRSFELSDGCASLVLPWVALREQLLLRHAASCKTLQELKAYLAKHGLGEALLPSRQGMSTATPMPKMVPATVYHLVKRTFAGIFKTPQGATLNKRKEGVKVAQGASIVRNSLIQQWAQTLGAAAAIERAGFERADSLRVAASLLAPVVAPDEPGGASTGAKVRQGRPRAAELAKK